MSARKIAFLYSEVAGYFLSGVEQLAKEADVLIFRWPVNNEAPFELSKIDKVEILDRSKFSQAELEAKLHEFNPDTLVCSGWMDKGYVKAVKSFKKKIPTVLTLDNHWVGSLKQRVATLLSRFLLKNVFSHAWVPGAPQAVFAKKLGYKGGQLLTGFYCANTDLFRSVFENSIEFKKDKFPRRFLYVARYVEHKGIFEMWEAFKQIKKELNTDWELWCLGTGDEFENRVESEGISHFGFVQPDEMEQYVRDTGVYILPSKFEPWGVTVQEFAISGFPLIVSEKVGSKTQFLNDSNGFEIKAGSVEDLKAAMKKMIEKSDEELLKMATESNRIGMSYQSADWANKVLGIK